MATFPDIKPLYQTPQRTEFRVLRNEFGDGYSQRSADGLNTQVTSYTYNVIVSSDDADTIVAFLDDRGGYDDFDYTLPRESTAKKWTCSEYTRTPMGPNTDRVMATFKQEFDLS